MLMIYIYIYYVQHIHALVRAGDLYVCGCGGSDYVNGHRLREGGDAASAEMVSADPRRVAASCASLRSMTSAISVTHEPDMVQVEVA